MTSERDRQASETLFRTVHLLFSINLPQFQKSIEINYNCIHQSFLYHFYKYVCCSRVYCGCCSVVLSSDLFIDNYHLYVFLFVTLSPLQQFLSVQSRFIDLVFLFLNHIFFLFSDVYCSCYTVVMLYDLSVHYNNYIYFFFHLLNNFACITTMRYYNNSNKHRKIKRKIDSKREILDL